MLFALTFSLIGHSIRDEEVSNDLGSAGVLQLTWLVGNHHHFTKIEGTEHQRLRQAGMFDVQFSLWARKRAADAAYEDQVSEMTMLNKSQDELCSA